MTLSIYDKRKWKLIWRYFETPLNDIRNGKVQKRFLFFLALIRHVLAPPSINGRKTTDREARPRSASSVALKLSEEKHCLRPIFNPVVE